MRICYESVAGKGSELVGWCMVMLVIDFSSPDWCEEDFCRNSLDLEYFVKPSIYYLSCINIDFYLIHI